MVEVEGCRARSARARRWSTLMSEVRTLAAGLTHGWDGATTAALSPGGTASTWGGGTSVAALPPRLCARRWRRDGRCHVEPHFNLFL